MTVSLSLRQAVYDRAGGCCDLCGDELLAEGIVPHHRKLKSQGGSDSLPNLLCLDADCHAYVHEQPALSYRRGWMVPNGRVPGYWMVPNGRVPGYWPVLRWNGWHLPDVIDGRTCWRPVVVPQETS